LSQDIIVAKHLSKSFDEVIAVDDLSFSVPQGVIYGFLGQNGAGKSTTIRMLLTLITPTSGEIEIFGMSLRKHRKEILRQTGAIIERPDLYKYLSAFENLKIFATMSGIKPSRQKLMEQLEKVGLAERATSKVRTYSQGMKQRLGIAIALIHDPGLIVLDEPTNGLDPQGIADIRHLIIHLTNDLGKTVFVSSHLLGEMEMIADHMLIIDKGKKIVEGTTSELLNPAESSVELVAKNHEETIAYIKGSEWQRYFHSFRDGVIRLNMDKQHLPAFTKELVNNGVQMISIRPVHTLEEYFLSLTH
jgi:ABC-type multidrug transport system ATPase subunit